MIPEFGLLSLIIALCFACMSASYPLWYRRADTTTQITPWVNAQAFFVVLAYGILTYLFLVSDFTVLYVASNSSSVLPWYYRMTAVWGAHEGSILLWVTILSLWMLSFATVSTFWKDQTKQLILSVLSFIQAGFLAFIVFTSSPFVRYFETKLTEGQDLNPLLQDPGFLIHPPVLYMGYVGFAIAFAVAVVGLAQKEFDHTWAKALRTWTQVAWAFLTMGIMLGSWWAYRELGWGGFWFWDPVENASFMPWLSGTALLHSLIVSEKRKLFYSWSLLLSLITFSLSLLGTFLVRSGVLTSVHAFASDPTRGIYILTFLSVVVIMSLTLFAKHGDHFANKSKLNTYSKETLLLTNNLILFVLMATVLLGTLYPLFMQMLNLGKLSVGAPYFNAIFKPLMIPLLFLMAISGYVSWQQDTAAVVLTKLQNEFIITMSIILFLGALKAHQSIAFYLGSTASVFLILSCIATVCSAKRGYIRSVLPMVLAHVGVAMTALGIGVNLTLSKSYDLAVDKNDIFRVGHYRIQFEQTESTKMQNYDSLVGKFVIRDKQGRTLSVLYPEKRYYGLRRQVMTDAAIYMTPFRDVYIALGNELQDGRYGIRVFDKPFIRWIWTGCIAMVIAIVMSLYNRRQLHANKAQVLASDIGRDHRDAARLRLDAGS